MSMIAKGIKDILEEEAIAEKRVEMKKRSIAIILEKKRKLVEKDMLCFKQDLEKKMVDKIEARRKELEKEARKMMDENKKESEILRKMAHGRISGAADLFVKLVKLK